MQAGKSIQVSKAEAKSNLEALKKGDSNAWAVVLKELGPGLLGYAIRMLGDKASAEDVVQDSLVNVYRNINDFDGNCSFKSWLYRAVRNRSIDEIRRSKRFVDVGETPEQDFFDESGSWREDSLEWDGQAARDLEYKNLLKIVHDEINKMPHVYRDVLLLKEVEGLETKEICKALDINAGNYRIRIHRARTALKSAVGYTLRKD